MYQLSEAFQIIGRHDSAGMWNGRVFCAVTDANHAFLTNKLNSAVGCFAFTIALQGHFKLISGKKEVTFGKNDLFTYLPGSPFQVLDISSDYRAFCLVVDEQTAYDTPAFRDLIQTSSFPLTQFGVPVLKLSAQDSARLCQTMQMIHEHILHTSAYKGRILNMLFSAFILDVQDIQHRSRTSHNITLRNEEHFISFYSLLRLNFIEHHDIGFYADRMNMTTTHLSRVVKQTTGRTVIEFINIMLEMEASWLLSTSDLTIAQIADRLNFATTASFDKFFQRIKGMSPKEYRNHI